ncbi:MAG: hypothetical protein AB1813_25660 [Verrucomicrobiota bacterium]
MVTHISLAVRIAAIFFMAGIGMAALAQTNAPVAPLHLFSTQPVPLRTLWESEKASRLSIAPEEAGQNLTVSFSSTSRGMTAENPFDRYRWMNGREALWINESVERGGAYGWFERTVLEPEIIRFKGISMTGSLVTAIKRKNPLCLLNPLVFAVSW